MTARSLAIIGLVVLAPGPAQAGLDDLHGGVAIEYEACYLDSPAAPGLALAGARIRAQAGGAWLQYRVGLDWRLGSTVPAGLAYDANLYPLGLGMAFGRSARLGIATGIGVSGARATMDDGWQVPIEAALELALGERLRLIGRGRVAWVMAAASREDGAMLPAGDELEASLALRLGHRERKRRFDLGNGYYLGVALRRSEGAQAWGVVLGHSVDFTR